MISLVLFAISLFSIEDYSLKVTQGQLNPQKPSSSPRVTLYRDQPSKTSPTSALVTAPRLSTATSLKNHRELPWLLELQLLTAVSLREFLFTFIHATCNKVLGIGSKYFIVRWVLSGDVPILSSLQELLQFGPITVYFFSFTAFSYAFSCLKSGVILNPAVGLGFVCTRKLRVRHFFLISVVDIFANFVAMAALASVVPISYKQSFDPHMFPTTMSVWGAIILEALQTATFVFWSSVSSHLKWSFEEKTSSNVIVRQICYALGYSFTRSCCNPAAVLGASAYVVFRGWRSGTEVLPYCIAYSIGPSIGAVFGTLSFQFLRTQLRRKSEGGSNIITSSTSSLLSSSSPSGSTKKPVSTTMTTKNTSFSASTTSTSPGLRRRGNTSIEAKSDDEKRNATYSMNALFSSSSSPSSPTSPLSLSSSSPLAPQDESCDDINDNDDTDDNTARPLRDRKQREKLSTPAPTGARLSRPWDVFQLSIEGAANCNAQEDLNQHLKTPLPPRTSLNFLSAFPPRPKEKQERAEVATITSRNSKSATNARKHSFFTTTNDVSAKEEWEDLDWYSQNKTKPFTRPTSRRKPKKSILSTRQQPSKAK